MTDTLLTTIDPQARDFIWQEKLERQRELEERGMALGGERFRKRLAQATEKGRGSTAGAAKRLVASAIEPLEKGIVHFVEEASGKRGGQHIAVKWLLRIGDERAQREIARKELKRRLSKETKEEISARHRQEGFAIAAYMTAKCIFDSLARKESVYTMSRTIAELILDELKYRRFKDQAPGLFDYRMNRFHTSSYAHMARSLGAAMRYAEIDVSDLEMTKAHKVHVGTKLIDLFAQTTGLVELRSERIVEGRGRRRKIRHDLSVHATPETLEWMQKRNDALEFLQPVSLPMIVPPRQWEKGQRGGYRFSLRDKFTLVRRVSKEHAETIDKAHMPLVYQALNAIQNTAWRINGKVLGVVQQLVERQSDPTTMKDPKLVAGIPMLAPIPEPERPHDIDTNEEARKDWRFKKGQIDSKNVQRAGEALAFSKILSTADAMRDEDAIFFPYNLDFRGRIYPVSNFLTPQGDDVCKGLLTFAQGKPIGDEGAAWLAVHGANCMDTTPAGEKVSKMTLQERVDWIFAHSEDLCLVAADPMGNRWWMEVEEPLQFLAFCFEWEQYRIQGPSYVCSLPISQDGTCNGLQHFSAMFRDEVGAAAVNLIPQDRPQDVYSLVAEDVKTALEQDIVSGTEEAKGAALWLSSGLVDRKVTKRPTMTFGYGSKQYGFQEQLVEFLRSHDNAEQIEQHFGGEQPLIDAASLMATRIWDALRYRTRAAFEGMAWLQKCARAIIKTGNPVEWVVPLTGFLVRQEYFVLDKKRVETVLAGRVIQPVLYEPTKAIEEYKQANAIAPNVVHSLDAAALMLTVSQAAAEGIESFAAVHDSYGCVPADMTLLAACTRQSFVRLYSMHNVVEELRNQFADQCPEGAEEFPVPPAPGKLDVSCVIASDYFFC